MAKAVCTVTDRVGQRFGNYQLVKRLGEGGFAEVYLGKHCYLNSHAALKVLNTRIMPGDERKFRAEAQTLADLRHPNIIHLLDFGIENETPVLTMDYAPNGSLRQCYAQGTQMPLTTVVDFVEQIASALQYAHTHNIIHRDVKPENILLDADQHLLLSDFGLSLLTPPSKELSTQDPAGTPLYIAPEQLQGKPCYASDQYALAVMVYEWLCGDLPFHGNIWEVGQHHIYTDPPPLHTLRPKLPLTIETVVLKALAKKPQERFGSIQAFAEALIQACQAYTSPVNVIDAQVANSPPITPHPLALTPPNRATPASPQNPPITQIPINAQAKDSSEPPPASTLQHQNRTRLLQRVHSFWITDVLEQSLHGATLIALGLQEQHDAVTNPWRLIVQESGHQSTPLPAGTRITDVYNNAGGELLILGEPGAGKTTLLLELARDQLKRAEKDSTYPIPVVFNLSSWTRKRQPLAIWLIEELEIKYKVPRKVGSNWVNTNQILPLLDGLDEVDTASRTACMQAINEYHQAHGLVPLIVCCRITDYRSQAHLLTLSRAVTIQPLTTEQINEYFARIGERIASLRLAFQHDPILQELATTPLMLTILIMVYQDATPEEITGGVSVEVRQQQIFATYTQRMLRRRAARSHYESQQTIRWLSYLAQQMKQQSQTVFYIERMQPTWLMQQWQRRLYYGLMAGPICGLFVGIQTLGTILSFPLTVLITALIVGLFFGWLSEPQAEKKNITSIWIHIRQRLTTSLEKRLRIGVFVGSFLGLSSALYFYLGDFDNWPLASRIVGALAGGLPNGICMGLCIGLVLKLERKIEPLEASSWSWKAIGRDIMKWLLIGMGLLLGVIFALSFMISSHDIWLGYFMAFGLSTALQLVLIIILVSGVTRGLSKRVPDAQHVVTPNQGIWRSARYGLVMAIITGGIAGVFSIACDFMAYFWLPLHLGIHIKKALGIDREAVNIMSHLLGYYPTTQQGFWMLHALFWGLFNAAIPALAVGLSCGGVAYIQHFVLRFLLWRTRRVPFNYSRFLDYAAERILLRKVGGGYIFIHRLLLEYFANLETETTPSAQTPTTNTE